jgi:hypothetical protein
VLTQDPKVTGDLAKRQQRLARHRTLIVPPNIHPASGVIPPLRR